MAGQPVIVLIKTREQEDLEVAKVMYERTKAELSGLRHTLKNLKDGSYIMIRGERYQLKKA